MNFDLRDEHRALELSVREWGAREVAPRIHDLDRQHRFDPDLLPRMAALGLLGVSIPVVTAMRDKARVAFCGNNLKQVGMAMGEYASDYQRRMPSATAGLGGACGGTWASTGSQTLRTCSC